MLRSEKMTDEIDNEQDWQKSHPCPVCNETIEGSETEEDYRAYCSVACVLVAHPEAHPNNVRSQE